MESIVRDKKSTINAMTKIAFGILLALAAQGYSDHAKADDAVPSAKENDMVLDKLKVEGTSNAQEGTGFMMSSIRSVKYLANKWITGLPAMQQIY